MSCDIDIEIFCVDIDEQLLMDEFAYNWKGFCFKLLFVERERVR